MARLRLTPQNREFFELYSRASANTVEIARLLVELLERFSPGNGDLIRPTVSGSVLGAGATKRLSAVRWGIAGNIVFAWLLTIPAAALVAAAFYWPVQGIF